MKKLIYPLLLGILSFTALNGFAQHSLTLSPVQDAYIQTYGGGEGKNTFFKFDITSIPANVVITNTYLTAWVYRHSAMWNGDMRYIFYTLQDWTEADSTDYMWNTIYFTDTIEQPPMSFGMVNGFSNSPDLTTFLLYNYIPADSFFSFFMKDPDDGTFAPPMGAPVFNNPDSLLSGNIFDDNCAFRPREYVNPNQRPTLTVDYGIPPFITSVMSNSPVCAGQNITVTANITGDSPFHFQWLKNGLPLAGDTLISLNIDPAGISDSGNYQCVASNAYGIDSSTITFVTVNPLPLIDLGLDTLICELDALTLDAGAGFDTYLWSDSSNGQTLFVDNASAGVYQYWVTVTQNSCPATDSITITETVCTMVEGIENINTLIYPNPAKDGLFNIQNSDVPYAIYIFDIQGNMILSSTVNSSAYTLDLRKFAHGLYSLSVISKNESSRHILVFD